MSPRKYTAARKSPARNATAAKSPKRATKKTGKRAAAKKRLSRTRKPEDMSLAAWQIELRRQFGRQQAFKLKNVGTEPIFSDFEVTNPETQKTYRVAIRGAALGENFCDCPDFAVNTLGTCKHVEFALGRLERKRGAKKALALGFRPEFSQVYLQYGARREVVFRPGTECPSGLEMYARRFFDDHGRLEPDAFARFHLFLKKVNASRHEIRCYGDAVQFIAEVRDKAQLAASVDKAFARGVGSPVWKKLLKVPLYRYQREGALFAARAGRCLLADDMGLGKTIQAIAVAEILARCAGVQRVLIVSPTSLKHQWKQEIEKFTDRDALVIEGLLPQRAELYATESFFKITNYDVVHRDLEAIRGWQPELIVLDEAQRIKNWKTRTAQSVKQLESDHALVLTGTPLENRLEELHSIVEFVDRFRLGPMFKFLDAHQHVDETGRVVGYRQLSKVSETLEPILVRRTKEKVLKELPERLDKRFFVPMTPQQMDHHEENREIVARIVHKWRRYGFLREADQQRMQIALQRMRMSCNSTYLLDPATDYGSKADEMIDLMDEILEDGDSKVVVFSQWLRMHELVVRRLKQRRWGHVLFHGGVPSRKRKDLVRAFKEDPDCRLFLSTDAGGVGLNLQNASAVVNLDQPWNPAVLEQRIGRVHRLGQHRPVRVVHFIAQGTIEHGMLDVLKFKKDLSRGVLDNGQDEVFLGGTRLRKFMESVEQATGAIPESMPTEADGREVATPAPAEAPSEAAPSKKPRSKETQPATSSAEQAWTELAAAGMSLIEKLGEALSAAGAAEPAAGGLPAGLVERDDRTGQAYLKLPVPEPETVQKVLDLFGVLAGRK